MKTHFNWLRWLLAPVLVAALALGAAGRAQAVEIDNDGVIAAGEVINDDVLLFGNQIQMDGTINGTLITSGQSVTINGTVNGDAIIWATTVNINGVINGNLFMGGYTAEIAAPVKGSAYVAGYGLTLAPAATVDRNLYFAGFSLATQAESRVGIDVMATGYQTLLSGDVGRDVLADAEAVELHGKVGRNVKAMVGTPNSQSEAVPPFFMGPNVVAPVAAGLRISAQASIGGKLTYTSAVNQDAAIKAAPAGGQEFVLQTTTSPTVKRPQATFAANVATTLVRTMRDFLTLLALGSLALWLMPALTKRVIDQARARPLPAAGWGLVTFFAGYLVIFVVGVTLFVLGILFAVVTFGGLANAVFGVGFGAVGLAAASFSLLVAYGSKLVVACLLGRFILQSLLPPQAENRFLTLLLGVVVLVAVRDLPGIVPVVGGVFGWVVGVMVTVVGLGAMWLAFQEWRAASRPSAAAPAPTPTPPALPG